MYDLDVINHLPANQFSAVNFDRIPKWAPEDLNFGTVAERQQRTDVAVQELATTVAALSAQPNGSVNTEIAKTVEAVESLNHKLSESLTYIQRQLDHLATVYRQSVQCARSSQPADSPRFPHAAAAASRPIPGHSQPEVDRSRNIIVLGLAEDKTHTVWQTEVSEVLSFILGQSVQIDDSFRLGQFTAGKCRPVLVRLQSAWDRRLIISNSACLSNNPRWQNVFVRPDESLQDRRLGTLNRLRSRAEYLGKRTSVVNVGDLVVDDILIFSVTHGWVVDENNAARASLFHSKTNGCT
jgi:hypothetical protein